MLCYAAAEMLPFSHVCSKVMGNVYLYDKQTNAKGINKYKKGKRVLDYLNWQKKSYFIMSFDNRKKFCLNMHLLSTKNLIKSLWNVKAKFVCPKRLKIAWYNIPYFVKVFGQTYMRKQCRPRSDAAERGVWSGSQLFAIHEAVF